MSVFWLAEKLGKFAHEVEDELTTTELSEYLAYYKIKHDEEEKEAKKLRQKANKKGPSRAGRRR